jgi:hypothetical protein
VLGFSNNDFSLLAGVVRKKESLRKQKTMKLRVRMPFRLGLPVVATTGWRSRDYAKKLRSFLAGNAPQKTVSSRVLLLCCIPGTCTTNTVERYCNPLVAKIFRAGKVGSMRTWTVYYKSCRDVNRVFITLVHVYTELVRRYTDHVR